MKNFLLIAGLIFSMLLSGCISSKTVAREDVKDESLSTSDISRFNSATVAKKDSTLKIDRSVTEEEAIITATTTRYSAPDSAGKQYMMEQTTLQEKVRRNTSVNISEKSGFSNEMRTQSDEKSKSSSTANVKISTSSKSTTKPSNAFTWIAVLISAGVILLGYLALKRFGLVK